MTLTSTPTWYASRSPDTKVALNSISAGSVSHCTYFFSTTLTNRKCTIGADTASVQTCQMLQLFAKARF